MSTVVFDKTGTLTSGKLQVKDLINLAKKFKVPVPTAQQSFSDKELFRLASLVEKNSSHPLAASIRSHLLELFTEEDCQREMSIADFKVKHGEGVECTLFSGAEKFRLSLGNEKLMAKREVDLTHNNLLQNIKELEELGRTVTVFTIDSTPRLLISLEEEHLAKEEASVVVRFLQQDLGLKVRMCTGDSEPSALRVAEHVGIPIENVTARAYPH